MFSTLQMHVTSCKPQRCSISKDEGINDHNASTTFTCPKAECQEYFLMQFIMIDYHTVTNYHTVKAFNN